MTAIIVGAAIGTVIATLAIIGDSHRLRHRGIRVSVTFTEPPNLKEAQDAKHV